MLGKVAIILEAQMAKFESDMGRAARINEKEMKRMERDARQSMRALRQEAENAGRVLGTALVAGAVATGLAIRNMLKDAEEIRRLSELSGLGAEAFQRMAAGARTVGIEQDKLADIMKDTRERIGEFIRSGGGEMADFFDYIAPKVGVTADAFARLSGPEAMQLYVDSLEKAGVGQNEMIAYMEGMASDASLLIPLLRDGGDGFRYWADQAEEAGAVMSGETLDATRELQIEMERVRLSIDGMWRQTLPNLLPKLKELAELLNSQEFRDGFATLINGAVDAIGALARLAVTTANVTKFLAESAASAIHGTSAEDLVRVEQRMTRIKGAIEGLRSGSYNPIEMSGNLTGIGLPSGKALELNADLAMGRVGSIIASLNAELIKEENKLEFGMKLAEDAAAQAARVAEEAMAGIETPVLRNVLSPEQIAAAEAAAKAAGKAAEELERGYESMNADLAQQIELYGETGRAAQLRYELEHGAMAALDPLRKQALIEQAEWLDWIEEMAVVEGAWADAAQERTDRWIESLTAAKDEMSVFAEQAGRNMQDAFADFLFDPFEDGLKGMLQSFGEILQRMAAQAAAAKIFESLGSYGNANTGTWYGDLLSGFFGGASSGGRAIGGPVQAGSMYEVGEGGRPELLQSHDGRTYLIPGSDGTVIPAGSTAAVGSAAPSSSGGAAQVEVNITNNGNSMEVDSVQAFLNEHGKMIVNLAVSEVNRQIGSMGGTGKSIQSRFGLQPVGAARG